MSGNIGPERLAARLAAAVERGDMTDTEAREEWLAAEEEAAESLRGEWLS